MPALFLPAFDLAALTAVLTALALTYLSYELARAVAGVLNFSILGVHPLANVAKALENSLVSWLSSVIDKLEKIARDLWHGFTWSIGVLLDGLYEFVQMTAQAIDLLRGVAIPEYVNAALAPVNAAIDQATRATRALGIELRGDIDRLRARVQQDARDLPHIIALNVDAAIDTAIPGIDAEIKAIRSSVDQAVDHALALARAESGRALGELRRAEDAAIGAIGSAQDLTSRELHDLLDNVNHGDIASLIAAVPLLTVLVNTLAAETGLDNAECRGKVKNICATNATDWSWLLGGLAVAGVGFGMREIVEAAREVIHLAEDVLDEVG